MIRVWFIIDACVFACGVFTAAGLDNLLTCSFSSVLKEMGGQWKDYNHSITVTCVLVYDKKTTKKYQEKENKDLLIKKTAP